MAEFRFTAIAPSGKTVSGLIHAQSLLEAKRTVAKIAEKNSLKVQTVAKKSYYLYKVIRDESSKPIIGEQKAFSKEEVEDALKKLGYKVIFVRKKLFDFQMKPPVADVVSFVRVSADLLKEKLSYGEILQLMINDINNKTLREALREINNDLKKGEDSEKVFLRYQNVLGKFTSYMLGLASKSGNMTEIYLATAKFLERRQEFKKNLRSALITPMITLVVLFFAVVYYVAYVFPATAELFVKFKIALPPMTAATLSLSYFLKDNFLWLFLGFLIPFLIFMRWINTEKGKLHYHKFLLKIPIIGGLIHKTLIEIFCRVFYTLYSGSAENIEPIRISAEATDNKYFESRIKNISIPLMIKEGKGITEAFEASEVFTKTAISRFHSGEETGTVKTTALQLANYYESETTYRLKSIIELIQVVIALIIMIVMTLLTLISAETATVRPKPPGVSFINIFLGFFQ